MMPRKYKNGTDSYSFALDTDQKIQLKKKNKLLRNNMLREAVKNINEVLKDEN
jgi:hypothetical protein